MIIIHQMVNFADVETLEEVMTRPSRELAADLARAPDRRVVGVARFSEKGLREKPEKRGVECVACGLLGEKMNLELLRIWKEAGKTIIFVTHGISEAVVLGSRVVVLTAGPARMADNFEIGLPHPRTLDIKTHERFGEYARRVYKPLGME